MENNIRNVQESEKNSAINEGTKKKQSGFGIASLIISIFSILNLFEIIIMINVNNMINTPEFTHVITRVIGSNIVFIALLCIIGMTLGILGRIGKNRKSLISILGVTFNIIAIIILIIIIIMRHTFK